MKYSIFFTFSYRRQLLLMLALFYLIFELFYVSKIYYFSAKSDQSVPMYALGAFAIDWVLVTLNMFAISFHTTYLLKREVSWRRIIILHIVLSVIISFVIRVVIELYKIAVGVLEWKDLTIEDFFDGLMFHLDVNYLIYAAMIFIIYAFHYLNEVRVAQVQQRLLETQLLNTRIQMLTSQLQPHFLFNTLNSISSLIDIDKEKAQDTLADLSEFLRLILFNIDSNYISIQKEFQILEPYLNILKTRFQNKIDINVTVQPDLLEVEVPTLLMQPLIENSIKHGTPDHKGILRIQVDVYSDDGVLVFEVKNSGSLKNDQPQRARKGLGISNLVDRLKSLYASAYTFEIKQIDMDSYTFVVCTVKIPF